jgi:hypothetical protein
MEVIRSVWEAAFDPLRQNPNDSAVTLRDGENVYLVDRSLVSDLERIHDFLINLPLLVRAVALEKVLYYLADALLDDDIKEIRAEIQRRKEKPKGAAAQ